MAKKRGLGRGLDALLASVNTPETPSDESTQSDTAAESGSGDGYRSLPLEAIEPGRYQPRRDLEPEALEDLANSIKAQGVMQPIVIRPIEIEGRYEIIAGERRWRASKIAGLTEIPVVIKDVPDDAAIAMALIENIQRENLNPMEEAIALQRLQDEFELTQQEVANAVGKSRSSVANLLRLMKLTPDVRTLLEHGDIEMGHARALLALEGEDQINAANEVVGQGLSVRQTEELVRKWAEVSAHKPKKVEKIVVPELESIAESLSKEWSTKVTINQNSKGKGKITIAYDSPESLESLLAKMKAE
jgi:ParB family chromosome partitioning protein